MRAQVYESHVDIVGSEGGRAVRRIRPVSKVLNVSAYKFVTLDDTPALRESIRSHAERHQLKGTVLLATEGINLVLAGDVAALHDFIAWLRLDSRFAALACKQSHSDRVPFRHLRVKVKGTIINIGTADGSATIRPDIERAPALSPATLTRWLEAGCDDNGREVVVLDTRNAFEVDHGRFAGALDWRLRSFGEFPAALTRHRAEIEGKTVVTYCTGGIRCEKAALLMRNAGLADVWQLDGGILHYLEQTQAPHWRGECFVFDERETLDPALRPRQPQTA
jgi:UPF0176 protein